MDVRIEDIEGRAGLRESHLGDVGASCERLVAAGQHDRADLANRISNTLQYYRRETIEILR